MLPKLTELLNALLEGDEVEATLDAPQALRELLHITHPPVPVGSLRRLWSLGGLKARIAFAYFAYWMRGHFQERDEKERCLLETHLKAAIKLLSTMTYLRGAVMKVGKFLATVPEIAPEEFVDTLASLHLEAPPCTIPSFASISVTNSEEIRKTSSRPSKKRPSRQPLWGKCTGRSSSPGKTWR